MRKTIVLAAMTLFVAQLTAQSLRVASYNVRNENARDAENGNGWEERREVVCNQILFHDFDIFGAQEVLKGQLDDMLAALPGYAYIGVGRSDGKQGGEYAPILYKTARFELIDSGHFWLSTTPDKPLPGWDARYERICTWGEFLDRRTGERFLFFNTHFDHVGVKARSESAEMIVARAQEMAGSDKSAIITGDFNVDQRNESYDALVSGGRFMDCFEAAPIRLAGNGTFNNFSPDVKTGSRIDHVLVTPDIEVLRYGILTDIYWKKKDAGRLLNPGAHPSEVKLYDCPARTPSDHYPILVEIEL